MKYFEYTDFDSPDALGSGKRYMDKDFLLALDAARELAGVPFIITSGYRTANHNAKVGGVEGSSHTKGLAADIACTTDKNRSLIIHALLEVGFTRIGIAKTFIHADLDSTKNAHRIWLY